MRDQRGAALLVLLMLILTAGSFLLLKAVQGSRNERDKTTAASLAQAKEALLGYAVTYRDTHPGDDFGYLPCPDTLSNNGQADSNQGATRCKGKDISVVGRLPWRTLGLPALRDSSGECLWYAVSGTFKAVAAGLKTVPMNSGIDGQFRIQDAGGTVLVDAPPRAAAVIFATHAVIGAQDRASGGAITECGGNITVANYLDIVNGIDSGANAISTITVATAASIENGTNNDRAIWITPDEIFDRIEDRSDYP